MRIDKLIEPHREIAACWALLRVRFEKTTRETITGCHNACVNAFIHQPLRFCKSLSKLSKAFLLFFQSTKIQIKTKYRLRAKFEEATHEMITGCHMCVNAFIHQTLRFSDPPSKFSKAPSSEHKKHKFLQVIHFLSDYCRTISVKWVSISNKTPDKLPMAFVLIKVASIAELL